jgi:hypothetical protein
MLRIILINDETIACLCGCYSFNFCFVSTRKTSIPIDQKTEEKKEQFLEYLIEKRKRILKHAIQNKLKPKDKQVLDAKRILKKEEVGLRDFRYVSCR